MRTLPIHLNRLDAALRKQGVALKRHQLLEACAAAFGHHNSNEFAAAVKAGRKDPPKAIVLGTAGHDSGRDLILLEDPVAGATYAVEREHLESEAFGPSPYGSLLDLRDALKDTSVSEALSFGGIEGGKVRYEIIAGGDGLELDPETGTLCAAEGDDKIVFLTNGCCESANGTPELLSRHGLRFEMDEGAFYPLTKGEEMLIAEDEAVMSNGRSVLFGYTVLHQGQKFACPTMEFHHGPGEAERRDALAEAKAYAANIRPKFEAHGGKVVVEDDQGDRICVLILMPFKAIMRSCAEFSDWKRLFALLAMPASGPRVTATFHPEAWQNDHAISVDAEGATEWDVTHLIIAMERREALSLKDNSDQADDLRLDGEAPRWIRDWTGPFRVEVAESVEAYFEALDAG